MHEKNILSGNKLVYLQTFSMLFSFSSSTRSCCRSSLGQGTGPSSQGNNSEDKSIHESNQTHVIDSSVSDFEQQIAELSASLVAIQQRLDLSANGLPTTIQRLLVEAEIRIDDVRGLKQARTSTLQSSTSLCKLVHSSSQT